MTDIVERLRQGAGHEAETIVAAEKTMDEAADEIERLREWEAESRSMHALLFEKDAEIERLRSILATGGNNNAKMAAEIERLRSILAAGGNNNAKMADEIERLRTIVKQFDSWELEKEIDRLKADLRSLAPRED